MGISTSDQAITDAKTRAFLESAARSLTINCIFEYGEANGNVWVRYIEAYYKFYKEQFKDSDATYLDNFDRAAKDFTKVPAKAVLLLIRVFFLDLLPAFQIAERLIEEMEAASPSNHHVTQS